MLSLMESSSLLTSLTRLVVRSAIFIEKVMVRPMMPISLELALKRLATAMTATLVMSTSENTWQRISMVLKMPE